MDMFQVFVLVSGAENWVGPYVQKKMRTREKESGKNNREREREKER